MSRFFFSQDKDTKEVKISVLDANQNELEVTNPAWSVADPSLLSIQSFNGKNVVFSHPDRHIVGITAYTFTGTGPKGEPISRSGEMEITFGQVASANFIEVD